MSLAPDKSTLLLKKEKGQKPCIPEGEAYIIPRLRSYNYAKVRSTATGGGDFPETATDTGRVKRASGMGTQDQAYG
jgi:hypothetical protein